MISLRHLLLRNIRPRLTAQMVQKPLTSRLDNKSGLKVVLKQVPGTAWKAFMELLG